MLYMMNEKKLVVDAYIGFNGNLDNNLILIRTERHMDKKTFKKKMDAIEKEEQIDIEKKKKLRKIYNLKRIDVNHNFYDLQREELIYHYFMIYVIGTNVIKEDVVNNERDIFKYNDDKITKLYVDKNNKYICCCKESRLLSDICIFDFENKKKPIILSLHKNKTLDVSISNDSRYILSSGGEDDKQLILTQIRSQKFIYRASTGTPYRCVKFFNKTNNFIVAKKEKIKICYYDFAKRLMTEEDVNTSIYKRDFLCMELKEDDSYAYLGTTTGDVFIINVKTRILEKIVPENYLFGNGVNVIKFYDDETILIGSGNGVVSLVNVTEAEVLKKKSLYGSINSIQIRNESTLFVSARENIIYVVDIKSNSHYVLLLQHNSPITDICFPFEYNYLMFTCGYNSVMAWQFYSKKVLYLKNIDQGKFVYYDKKFLPISEKKKKRQCLAHEILLEGKEEKLQNKKEEKYKIINKNLICHSIKLTNDGKYIALTIHNNIYILTPRYMKTITIIYNAHHEYCTIAIFHNTYDLISAGNKGDVKFWKWQDRKYVLLNSIHYHNDAINQIVLHKDTYLCSCSQDGLITLYNIKEDTLKKKIVDISNTRYRQMALNKKFDILLCAGNNNILMYYDLVKFDISKHFYYSPYHTVQYLDINDNGKYFITGADDFKIRLYDFKSCTCLYVGSAHNDSITKCVFTYDNQYIISTSKDESIIYWQVPKEIQLEEN